MSDPIFDIGRDLQRAYDEGYEQGKADAEQKDVPDTNVGELINRQAAKSKAVYSPERHEKVVPVAELDWLPSVEPERKTGKWIRGEAYPHHIYCSECYKTFIPNDELRVWANGDIPRKYCPECGVKMEVNG